MVLYWVVRRDAKTDALITFRSFQNYADAEKHKAELDKFIDCNTSTVTIEAIPTPETPR